MSVDPGPCSYQSLEGNPKHRIRSNWFLESKLVQIRFLGFPEIENYSDHKRAVESLLEKYLDWTTTISLKSLDLFGDQNWVGDLEADNYRIFAVRNKIQDIQECVEYDNQPRLAAIQIRQISLIYFGIKLTFEVSYNVQTRLFFVISPSSKV